MYTLFHNFSIILICLLDIKIESLNKVMVAQWHWQLRMLMPGLEVNGSFQIPIFKSSRNYKTIAEGQNVYDQSYVIVKFIFLLYLCIPCIILKYLN